MTLATALGRQDDGSAAWHGSATSSGIDLVRLAGGQHGRARHRLSRRAAAELGDFDATSTTIALAPGGEHAHLPQDLLLATFERYWREFVDRRDGRTPWEDYTPYELRTVGTFVRLGWRERAQELLDFFFADRRPPGVEPVGRSGRARACASRASSATCRMAGSRPTSSARRSTSSPTSAKSTTRSCWRRACHRSGWKAKA